MTQVSAGYHINYQPSNSPWGWSDLFPQCRTTDSSWQHDDISQEVRATLARKAAMVLGDVLTRFLTPPRLSLLKEGVDALLLVSSAEGSVVEPPLELLISPQLIRCKEEQARTVSNGAMLEIDEASESGTTHLRISPPSRRTVPRNWNWLASPRRRWCYRAPCRRRRSRPPVHWHVLLPR